MSVDRRVVLSWVRPCVTIVLCVALAVLSLSPGAPPRLVTEASAQGLSEYTLGPGDSIEITVLGEPDLTRTVSVRPDGRINLPLIGDVEAAGLTPTQLSERIATALRSYLKNPQVAVSVREFQRAFVYLVGQVMRPGAVEIQRGWTVLEVMGVAGGVTPRAAARRTTIIRRGTGQTLNIDLDRLLSKGDRTANVAVEPGDIIMVPTLQTRVLVLGSVRTPGAYDLDDGARLLDALASAGGTADRAGVNNIGVIRSGPDGRPAVTSVDLNRILRGDATLNVPLQAEDVVYVPQGPLVQWLDVLTWLSGLGLVRSVFRF
jgi:polysaccharide export outer membrane protein